MSSRLICLAALLATAPAFAATPIDQTRPLSPTGSVSIDNTKGRIVVRGWDRPEVKLSGSLGDGVEKLEVTGSANALRIEVRYPSQGGWFGWGGDKSEPSVIEVMVPVRATVAVDSVSAEVEVDNLAGARLTVDTVSGNVTVRGARPGEARFDTVSGDLDLQLDSDKTSADSVSGDVRLQGRINGEISLDSVSGNLSLDGGTLEQVDVGTVSGDATLALALAPGARLNAETLSGDLRLDLPAGTSARISVESFSGSIRSPVGKVVTEQYGPGSTLEGRLGDGSARIELESFSGDVSIRTTATASAAPEAKAEVEVE